MQEILVVTADDLAGEQARAAHGRLEHELLALVARSSRTRGPVLLRFDFPGGPNGGFHLQPRRLTWLGRLFWWCHCGSRPLPLEMG